MNEMNSPVVPPQRIGACRFCRKDAKLIKAHVIPEAFLALPSGEDGPAKILSPKPGIFPKKTLTGIYDNEILCATCDGELGKLDQHAVESILRAPKVTDMRTGDQTLARQYPDADAELIGRFIASVLWRASISGHYFFSRVTLGPYEAIIRAILVGDAQEDGRVQTLLAEFDKKDASILNPHQTRTDGVRFWVIYANRFILYTKTDRQGAPGSLAPLTLMKGRVVTSVVRPWEGSKEYPLLARIAAAHPKAFATR
jgi:hypothetical protein